MVRESSRNESTIEYQMSNIAVQHSANSVQVLNSYVRSNNKIIIKENGNKTVTRNRVKCVDNEDECEKQLMFDTRVLGAKMHPTVAKFFELTNEQIIARFRQLQPKTNTDVLRNILHYQPSYFMWAGSDLMKVATNEGQQKMIVVETNSCPSGAKYMTFDPNVREYGAYGVIIEETFKRLVDSKADPSLGGLAVVCDKNAMGTTGYAMTIAKIMKERVWYVEFYDKEPDPPVRWNNGVLFVRDDHGGWHPIRACFRYLTQKPWNRFPIHSKTLVMNNVLACLCGGRNKMMASYAYDFFNRELFGTGLEISIPETLCNVAKTEIPKILHEMGGLAVIKVPYSNAGQGVYTITSETDLQDFMEREHHYDKFIVQSLVGDLAWTKVTNFTGKYYHVGMVPNSKNHIYVYDLRMIITAAENGFRPVAIYARKARNPLLQNLGSRGAGTSWEMLGTNLSYKCDGKWKSEVSRLMIMDVDDFNQLGIGLNDLIDGYIQTVLSVIAIDKMCHRIAPKGIFDMKLFNSFNPDVALLEEILVGDI